MVAAIALHDRELASQLKRAASSCPLNIAEGARRTGRDRKHCYRIAAGSAAEARAALAVAAGWDYVEAGQASEADEMLDRVLAMLYRLSRG